MFTVAYLNELRRHEWDAILDLFPPGCRILEVGAGTGAQAVLMTAAGFDVSAIDLTSSNYAQHRVFPVVNYDGRTFPFPDGTFDVVFSSNVLEHVREPETLHRESKRVLKQGGACIHIMPTHVWRFWTSVTSLPALFGAAWQFVRSPQWNTLRRMGSRGYVLLRQPRHGERGNTLTELWTFSPRWWRHHFLANGFQIVAERGVGFFYTGESVLASNLSFASRQILAQKIGSACHVFKLRFYS